MPTNAMNSHMPGSVIPGTYNLKDNLMYRLTSNIEDASPEETDEILEELEKVSDDDLEVSSVKIVSF